MGELDRQRHELGGLVARIAEHESLVTGAAGVHAHGDVGRLRLNDVQDSAGLRVEPESGIREPNVGDHLTREGGDVYVGRGCDLARHDANAGRDQHLARNATLGVIFQDCIQHCIGDLIRHLIGMAFSYGLRRENVPLILCHSYASADLR